jgi:uncharacterized protein YdhG (YjbR/CyaY superfamily)
MANSAFGTVDDYLASQPERVAPILSAVRDAIRAALPNAEEGIAYNLPAYKINGKQVIFFAGWKNHYSVYPASDDLVAAFASELSEHKVVKSTIQFSYAKPVPEKLIREIAEFRAFEASAK